MALAEKLGTIPVRDEFTDLRAIYDSLQDTIKKMFQNVTLINYSKSLAAKKIRELNRKIMEVNIRTMIWAERAARDSYKIGAERTEATLNAAKFEQVKIIPIENAVEIGVTVDLISRDMAKANKTIIKSMKKYFNFMGKINRRIAAKIQEQDQELLSDADLFLIEDIIQSGYLAHEVRGKVSKRIYDILVDRIGEGNLIEIIDKNGKTIHYNPRKYAEMVARTRLRELQTQAVKNMCGAYGCDLVVWSTHDNPCPKCEPFEGRVFSLSGKHPDYPFLKDEPPLHPRCEHNINPATNEERQYKEQELGILTSGFGGKL